MSQFSLNVSPKFSALASYDLLFPESCSASFSDDSFSVKQVYNEIIFYDIDFWFTTYCLVTSKDMVIFCRIGISCYLCKTVLNITI